MQPIPLSVPMDEFQLTLSVIEGGKSLGSHFEETTEVDKRKGIETRIETEWREDKNE